MKTQKSLLLKYNTQQELFSALVRRHHYTVKENLARLKAFLKLSLLRMSTALNSIL